MTNVLGALVPVFLVIAMGWGLKRADFAGDGFWRPLDRLVYYVLFPALLVTRLSHAELAGLKVAPLAGVMISTVLVMAFSVVRLGRRLDLDGAAFTSLFQGAIRNNTYVGFAVAAALLGDAGLTLAAVAVAALVPTVNLLCVTVLVRNAGPAGRPGGRALAGLLARNPLILACVAGIALGLSGLALPGVLDSLLAMLGRAALPLALIAVGAGLVPEALRGARSVLAWAATLKLIALPALALLASALLGVEGATRTVAVLFAAMPAAPSSYVLARQLGGDAGLMAGIVTLTTFAAALTLPLWLLLLG